MSELRRDPFTGRWRLFAEGRSARPNEYAAGRAGDAGLASCPFCVGRESRTPPELAAVRPSGGPPNGPGWTVRSIPNRFPTLDPGATTPTDDPAAFFRRAPGRGLHEVIVTAPTHAPALSHLSVEQRGSVFRFLRDRVRAAGSDPAVRSSILLENNGPDSGGTLPHPHAQLLAMSFEPDRVREEADAFEHDRAGCALEGIAAQERVVGERIVGEDDAFLTWAPFASEFPLELWILPRAHRPSYAEATDPEVDRLADLLPELLRALDAIRPGASYNWFVHGLAGPGERSRRFHWHVELTPRLHRADAFEIASGLPVNSVLPERAAEEYRRALAENARSSGKR